jgi:hypothetical protein
MPLKGQSSGAVQMGLLPWQRYLWSCPARFLVLNGGRRAGKSRFMERRVLSKLLSHPTADEAWIVSQTYRSVKSIHWQPLVDLLERQEVRLLKGKNETELRFDLEGGKRLYLKGLEEADSLRGKGLAHLGITEASLLGAGPFDKVLRPMLSDTKGGATIESTPRGRGWFYELARMGGYCEQGQDSAQEPDWFYVNIPTANSGTVDADEMRNIKEHMDPDDFAEEYEGVFLGYRGLLIPEFVKNTWPLGNWIPEKLWLQNRTRMMAVESMDWGMGSKTVVLMADVDPYGRTIIYDEYVVSGKSLRVIAEEVKAKRTPGRKVQYTVADKMMWRREYDGNVMAEQLNRLGFYMIRSDSRFHDSVSLLRGMAAPKPIEGDPLSPMPMLMIVEGRCPNLVHQLKRTENLYPEREGHECVGDQTVDALDACRYMVMKSGRPGTAAPDEEDTWPPPMRLKRRTATRYHSLSGLPMGLIRV